jgi:predicted permease
MNWWLRLRRRRRLDRDLHEELAFHREMRARDTNPPPFGSEARIRESLHDLWRFDAIETTLRDFVFAARGLRRSPVLTLTLVTSLALGIGAVIAIFTAADTLLFRRLPYPEPDRLVMLWETNHTRPDARHHAASADNVLEWQAHSRAIATMAIVDDGRTVFRSGDQSEELHLQGVSASFFSVLGVQPLLGRAPDAPSMATASGTPRLAAPGLGAGASAGSNTAANVDADAGADAVFISHRLWRTWFGAAADIVGRRVSLDARPFVIGGVMPASFGFGDRDVDLWTVMHLQPSRGGRGPRTLRVVARLAPGVTLDGARAEMTALARGLAEADPAFNTGWTVTVEPLRDALTRDVKLSLLLLLASVGLLLIVACANAANLLLARNASRRADLALRAALGASHWRLTRFLLIESLLLTAAAGGLGIAIGWWTLARLIAFAPPTLTHAVALAIDWRIVWFAIGLSTLTGLLFGVGPSLAAARATLQHTLQQACGHRASSRGRARDWLIASEIAVAVLLLTGATVLARSLLRLQAVDPGLNPARVLTFHFRVGSPKDVHLFSDLIDRIGQLPGVRAASATSFLPFSGPAANTRVTVPGRAVPAPGDASPVVVRTILPRYFATLGVPITQGRELTDADNTRDAPLRFVVNEAFVRRFLPAGTPPVGQSIVAEMSRTNPPGEIIGVVGDVREGSLAQAAMPTVYYPYARLPYGQMHLVVRSDGDPAALIAPVRRLAHDLDPGVALADIETMGDVVRETYAPQQFSALLMGSFALFAATLAAVGLYGVVHLAVAARTREIAIRLALGAPPRRIGLMVLRDTSRYVLAGLVIGLIAAFELVTLLGGLLFEIQARDPWAFAAACLMLLAAAAIAAAAPVWRATHINPVRALRAD